MRGISAPAGGGPGGMGAGACSDFAGCESAVISGRGSAHRFGRQNWVDGDSGPIVQPPGTWVSSCAHLISISES